MIASKSEFLRLWGAGALGNRLRTWPSLEAAGDYPGPFGLRERRPNSPLVRYFVAKADVPAALAEMKAAGAEGVYLGEMSPDHRMRLQAFYLDGLSNGAHHNHVLTYSTEQVPFKRVKEWRHAEGSASLAILRHVLEPGSLEEVESLRDRYPGHVIELGAYDCHLGNVPGRNHVIWEVRNY